MYQKTVLYITILHFTFLVFMFKIAVSTVFASSILVEFTNVGDRHTAETGFNYPQNTEVSLTSCFYICCKPDDISGSRWGLLYNKWTQYGQTLPPPNIEL